MHKAQCIFHRYQRKQQKKILLDIKKNITFFCVKNKHNDKILKRNYIK